MKKVTYIYVLKCPKTDEVRYVGKSNNPKRRYYGHLRIDKTACSYKKNWVQSLLKQDLRPVLEVIKEVPIREWKVWEKYYIKYYKKKGCRLTNLGQGGEGLEFGNQTSFKKGFSPWNKGTRMKKKCAVCLTEFEVSPSGNKKYKCCSLKCRDKYKSLYPNKGTFKKGQVPHNLTPVLQLDTETMNVVAEYNSIKEAHRLTGIIHISCVINGHRKTAGGFKWERKENL